MRRLADNPRTLSLSQMMKLVIYCAVASACIGPMLRLWQAGVVQGGSREGLITVAIFEGVAVPLAWAGLSFVLIRPGAWRDGVITGCLLCSASVALGFACWLFFAFALPNARGEGFLSLAIFAMVIIVLTLAVAFLSRRLWRGTRRLVDQPG